MKLSKLDTILYTVQLVISGSLFGWGAILFWALLVVATLSIKQIIKEFKQAEEVKP